MIIALAILAYLVIGAFVIPLLGKAPMFKDMVGIGDNDDVYYRGLAILIWPMFAALGVLFGVIWAVGRLATLGR
jgi:hypothetical protein